MQGKKQRVQKRVLELNSRPLFAPCGRDTLSLVVGDRAKSFVTSIGFFGLLQQLYTLFSSSVHCWTILKNFTLKALSTSRMKCQVEAVKAVHYQLPKIVKALTALQEYATEKRDADAVSTAGSCTIVLFQIYKSSKIPKSPKVSVQT